MNRLPYFHYNLVPVLQLREIEEQFVRVAETCWDTVVCRPGRLLRAAPTDLLTPTRPKKTPDVNLVNPQTARVPAKAAVLAGSPAPQTLSWNSQILVNLRLTNITKVVQSQ